MDIIQFSDCTLQHTDDFDSLSFREKLEFCKKINKLNISAVELHEIRRIKADTLLIKSICSAVQDTTVVVPVGLDNEKVDQTWNAVKNACMYRLQITVPVSSVQMEYILHMKPQTMLSALQQTVRHCLELTDQIEFVAEDATRADPEFLSDIVTSVLQQGIRMITFQDAAGSMLPEEVSAFFEKLLISVPMLQQAVIGYSSVNSLSLADACAVAAIRSGVRLIKGSMVSSNQISIGHVARILESKGSEFGATTRMNIQQIDRIAAQLSMYSRSVQNQTSQLKHSAEDSETIFTVYDSPEANQLATGKLGYDLSPEDMDKIYGMVQTITGQKGQITLHELDALIAAEAMQVPAVYTDVRYMVNTGTALGAMAHMKIRFHDRELVSISSGDGAIDAAFLAIEQAIGRHFELDDFQIQTITEGREAMGEALVKIRHDGKLYSGRSVSTDIVGASIMAYISALNKIVYEEGEA